LIFHIRSSLSFSQPMTASPCSLRAETCHELLARRLHLQCEFISRIHPFQSQVKRISSKMRNILRINLRLTRIDSYIGRWRWLPNDTGATLSNRYDSSDSASFVFKQDWEVPIDEEIGRARSEEQVCS
jgi:hypothetical protein